MPSWSFLSPRNLAKGKSYRIGAQWPDKLFSGMETQQYPNKGQLTSGRQATISVKDPGWLGLLRQYGRSIIVDLEKTCKIEWISLKFLLNIDAGILVPSVVFFYVSLDGTRWTKIGSAHDSAKWYEKEPQIYEFKLERVAYARFVRAQFVAKVYAFVNDFIVYGSSVLRQTRQFEEEMLSQIMGDNYLVDLQDTKIEPIQVRRVSEKYREIISSGYLIADNGKSSAIRNLALIYTGAHDLQNTWTVDDFLPMVTYMTVDREIAGWLFDGALFVPYGKMPTSAAAWSSWVVDLFTPSTQLFALEEAVGRAKEVMHDPEHKVRCVITIPSTISEPSDFGSIEPRGRSFVFDHEAIGHEEAFKNKRDAIRWLMQMVLHRWGEAMFAHLQLTGFYWQPEFLNEKDPYDIHLIQSIALDIHAKDLMFYWIPFYGAPGIPDAGNLGFDCVMLQPGVSFHGDIDSKARFEACVAQAKYYHMGIELELHWDILNRQEPKKAQIALEKYEEYLQAGILYGFSTNVMKAYYLGSKSFLQCFTSDEERANLVYEDTVRFINGSYSMDDQHQSQQ